jgi:hypothetical protein
MKYKGILITDAMNMGGLGGYSEERASLQALSAGVDILLHPSDTEKIIFYLKEKKAAFTSGRLEKFRRGLSRGPSSARPDFKKNRQLSDLLTKRAIRTSGRSELRGRPFLFILNDDDDERGKIFAERLKTRVPATRLMILNRGPEIRHIAIPDEASVIVAVFSETKAWKGGASDWLYRQIASLEKRADLFVSFGSPYLFDGIKDAPKMYIYWDSGSAQAAAADLIAREYRSSR